MSKQQPTYIRPQHPISITPKEDESDYLSQYLTLFNKAIACKLQTAQISDWYQRNQNKPQCKTLKSSLGRLHECIIDLENSHSEEDILRQRCKQLEQEAFCFESEIEMLEDCFVEGKQVNPTQLVYLSKIAEIMRNGNPKFSNAYQLRHINSQVTEKLLQMKQETEKLVKSLAGKKQLSEGKPLQEKRLQEELSRVKKELQLMKNINRQINNQLNSKIESYEQLKCQLQQQYNISLQPDILAFQEQIVNLQQHINLLTKNQLYDHGQIKKLMDKVKQYERQEKTVKQQLQRLMKGYQKIGEEEGEGKLEEKMRRLEEQINIHIEANRAYAENNRNLEIKLKDLERDNIKMINKNKMLNGQLKELSDRVRSQSQSRQQRKQEYQMNEKRGDQVMTLKLTIEMLKSQLIEQVRKRNIINSKVQELGKTQSDIEQHIQLFLEKRTLEDENKLLLEIIDKMQIQLKQYEKKYRKLQKKHTSQSRYIDQLQLQIRQLCPKQSNTQRTATGQYLCNYPSSLTSGNPKNKDKNQFFLRNQQLRLRLRQCQQQKTYYIKVIKEQVVNSGMIEYEAKLEKALEKIKYLEKIVEIQEKKLKGEKKQDDVNSMEEKLRLEVRVEELEMETDALKRELLGKERKIQELTGDSGRILQQNGFRAKQNQYLMNQARKLQEIRLEKQNNHSLLEQKSVETMSARLARQLRSNLNSNYQTIPAQQPLFFQLPSNNLTQQPLKPIILLNHLTSKLITLYNIHILNKSYPIGKQKLKDLLVQYVKNQNNNMRAVQVYEKAVEVVVEAVKEVSKGEGEMEVIKRIGGMREKVMIALSKEEDERDAQGF